MLDSTEKDFQVAIITMFTELRGSINKEVKEGMLTMLHQIDNINKEIEIILKDQMEVMEMKIRVTET